MTRRRMGERSPGRLRAALRSTLAGGVLCVALGLPLGQERSTRVPEPSSAMAWHAASVQDDSLDFDPDRLLQDLGILAHDSMEGRRSGSDGNARARRFLIEAFEARGLPPLPASDPGDRPVRTQDFLVGDRGRTGGSPIIGTNVLGWIEGTRFPSRYIVVTAHYDHLGTRDGEIFNGADDNASGVAALLALAEAFLRSPPRHSLVFAALDAEEMGLLGARAFVSDAPVPLDSVLLNVNLDMVSRSEPGELYVAGTHHHPTLIPLVEEVARDSNVALLMGHDSPELPAGDDWTMASDHAAFHEAGIPFAYFGVEDHAGYHRPGDTVEAITPGFFVDAVDTVARFVRMADESLGSTN